MVRRQREVSDIANIETGYSIPFSKEKMNELRQIGLSQSAHFSVEHSNGIRISVETFEDLRDGEYNELNHFGTIPNDVQRRRWINENGLQKDEEQLALALRQKLEGGNNNNIPQRNVTAEEVKGMIDTALSDSNNNNNTTTSDNHKSKSKKKRTSKE